MNRVIYRKTSPYYSTAVTDNYLDILTPRPIDKKPDDYLYVLEKKYEHRPDLLAHELYGDSGLWWVFMARNPNVIEDPIFDFVSGISIFLPKKDTLTENLGL